MFRSFCGCSVPILSGVDILLPIVIYFSNYKELMQTFFFFPVAE
jgi:hypothetical protein